jgi:predicted butyrate kinase (DUF1464 family)
VRVIGIDPGTVSIDICGLQDGRVFLDLSLPTAEALADPSGLLDTLGQAGRVDLIAGPSGYGLPLVFARDLTDADLRLACLAPEGTSGGIAGLRTLMRTLSRLTVPVVFTPGVVHLPSVPPHRKVNRIDMGTADKVCAAALAVADHAAWWAVPEHEATLLLLEIGGAFTAALAIEHGRIVDGAGGSAGPLGMRAAGALDGEVAFLAGAVSKDMLFRGGAATIAGMPEATIEALALADTRGARLAREAFLESAVKALAALMVAVPNPREVALSGRGALVGRIHDELAARLRDAGIDAHVRVLTGFATAAKQAAQGAALVADGLAGGASKRLVQVMGLREAAGTVLDHLHVISPEAARRRLGLEA